MAAVNSTTATPPPKSLAELERVFPSWLWSACQNHLLLHTNDESRYILNRKYQRKDWPAILSLAYSNGRLKTLTNYPPRLFPPAAPTNPCSSIRKLLYLAPALPKTGSGTFGEWKDLKGIQGEYDGVSGDYQYDWSPAYKEEMFGCLLTVIEEDGWGQWEAIRWEIYDKYALTMGGVTFIDSNTVKWWHDHARVWVDQYSGALFRQYCCQGPLGKKYYDTVAKYFMVEDC